MINKFLKKKSDDFQHFFAFGNCILVKCLKIHFLLCLLINKVVVEKKKQEQKQNLYRYLLHNLY